LLCTITVLASALPQAQQAGGLPATETEGDFWSEFHIPVGRDDSEIAIALAHLGKPVRNAEGRVHKTAS